jgi:hypothetical protein
MRKEPPSRPESGSELGGDEGFEPLIPSMRTRRRKIASRFRRAHGLAAVRRRTPLVAGVAVLRCCTREIGHQLGKTRIIVIARLVWQLMVGAKRSLVTSRDPSRNRHLAREWPEHPNRRLAGVPACSPDVAVSI